jgi:phage shock protein A
MGYQFRIAPEIEQLAARLTAPVHNAWRGRPGSEARRTLGKIGFWIAQPGLDAACQRQLEALRRSRRNVADVATAAKRLELQIAELERQADEDGGQGNTTERLAELRRQHAGLQARQERATVLSQRLMAEINAFRAGKEATRSAYTAAEEVAKTMWHRSPSGP